MRPFDGWQATLKTSLDGEEAMKVLHLLLATSLLAAVGLAGCAGGDDEESTPRNQELEGEVIVTGGNETGETNGTTETGAGDDTGSY